VNREEATMTLDPNGPGDPNGPEGVDTAGKTVPPYDGRRESADLDSSEESVRGGAKVGGATGPVADDERKAPEPADTPRGATGSPSDEQPAGQQPETDLDDDRVGPSHQPGTPRAEDKS
jgi:hypothetical protein